jgi:hypothetical protein
MPSRELVWVVLQGGRLELGRPDEPHHNDLMKRLGRPKIVAGGVIKKGRAKQTSPLGDHQWEPKAQERYDGEYVR